MGEVSKEFLEFMEAQEAVRLWVQNTRKPVPQWMLDKLKETAAALERQREHEQLVRA